MNDERSMFDVHFPAVFLNKSYMALVVFLAIKTRNVYH